MIFPSFRCVLVAGTGLLVPISAMASPSFEPALRLASRTIPAPPSDGPAARRGGKRKERPAVKRVRSRRKRSRRPGRRASRRRERFPPMMLIHANTGEKAAIRVYDRRGRVSKVGLRQLNRFLRCRHTGRQRPIVWRLAKYMYSISRHFTGKPIYVYSGYRPRAIARLKTSNHIKGRAVDLRVRGVSNRRLRDFLRRRFKNVGVGYYPNSLFIHFDVRARRSAFWVDVSGPGEASEYVDAKAVLDKERGQRRRGREDGDPPTGRDLPPVVAGPPPLGPAPTAVFAPR